MKRILLGMLMVIVFGCNVQAAQFTKTEPLKVGADSAKSIDVKAVMEQAEKNLQSTKVYGIQITMNNQILMDVAVDLNTKVIYGTVPSENGDVIVWGDINNKISYMYVGSMGEYYFSPNDASLSELEKQRDSAMQTVQNDNAVTYQYVGKVARTVRGQVIECYQIRAEETEAGETSTCDYYISIYENQIVSTELTMQGTHISDRIKMLIDFYYPESLSIPKDIIEKATLMPGYSVTKSMITYTVKYVKGQPVFCVSDGYRTGKNVKILDSIMVCGKAYPVYEISDAAFLGNSKVKTVTIGKNVQVIGKKAFYKCKKLSTVKINAGNLKTVGKYAFKGTAKSCKVKVAKKKFKRYKKLISSAKSGVRVTK